MMKKKKTSGGLRKVALVVICCASLALILSQDWLSSHKEPETHHNEEDLRKQQEYFEPKFVLDDEEIEELAKRAEFKEFISDRRRLLNLNNLSYLLEPHKKPIECAVAQSAQKQKLLLILVNSKWSNFKRRKRMRSGWLSEKNLHEQVCASDLHKQVARVELVFILGLEEVPSSAENGNGNGNGNGKGNGKGNEFENGIWIENVEPLNGQVRAEWDLNGDILLVNLREHYRMISLKHLAAIKWLLKQKRLDESETLVLKCDDDAQVELAQLLSQLTPEPRVESLGENGNENGNELLARGSGSSLSFSYLDDAHQTQVGAAAAKAVGEPARNWIMCAHFPEGTQVLREQRRKWRLTRAEYPFARFPAYCSGLAYLTTRDLLRKLYLLAHLLLLSDTKGESHRMRFADPLWVDDVFVTGILTASLANSVRVIRLNGHFCYSQEQQLRRARAGLPCAVAELHATPTQQHPAPLTSPPEAPD